MKFWSQNSKKNKAFTLAEVLITLGIIGVVAALTIPNLIANSQKVETVTRLQKIYSVMSSAVKISEAENGMSQNWTRPNQTNYTPDSTKFWEAYLIPYIPSVKKCSTHTNTACWASGIKNMNGSSFMYSANIPVLVLKDGMSVAFYLVDEQSASFVVDINGLKKPNVQGKDIFFITLYYLEGKLKFAGEGKSREELLSDEYVGCNKLSTGFDSGAYCGALIRLDGWQIKDDFPWN